MLVGPTNTGKSALLAALTNAEPEVSPAPYTTWQPLPGMMPVENIQVQLVDTPSMEAGLVEPGLFDLVRHVDLLLIVVDLQADPLRQMQDTLALLLEHRIGEQFNALVTGAADKGTWVRVFEPPVEGRVERGAQGLRVGDKVRVRLLSTNFERGFIDFARAHRA